MVTLKKKKKVLIFPFSGMCLTILHTQKDSITQLSHALMPWIHDKILPSMYVGGGCCWCCWQHLSANPALWRWDDVGGMTAHTQSNPAMLAQQIWWDHLLPLPRVLIPQQLLCQTHHLSCDATPAWTAQSLCPPAACDSEAMTPLRQAAQLAQQHRHHPESCWPVPPPAHNCVILNHHLPFRAVLPPQKH